MKHRLIIRTLCLVLFRACPSKQTRARCGAQEDVTMKRVLVWKLVVYQPDWCFRFVKQSTTAWWCNLIPVCDVIFIGMFVCFMKIQLALWCVKIMLTKHIPRTWTSILFIQSSIGHSSFRLLNCFLLIESELMDSVAELVRFILQLYQKMRQAEAEINDLQELHAKEREELELVQMEVREEKTRFCRSSVSFYYSAQSSRAAG